MITSMKKQLVCAMLAAGLIPLIIVAVMLGIQATQLLGNETDARLRSELEGRKTHIESYMQQLLKMNAALAVDETTVAALAQLTSGFKGLATEKPLNDSSSEAVSRELSNYYLEVFRPAYQEMTGSELALDTAEMLPSSLSGRIAQWLYVVNNQYPLHQKDKLYRSGDRSSYSEAHGRFHRHFVDSKQLFDLFDVFLIDAESRSVVYSVVKETDFGVNLNDASLSSSGLAKAVEMAIANPDSGPVFIDMSSYLASFSRPSAFVASVIKKGNKTIGVVALQLTAKKLEALTSKGVEHGLTEQIFIVGSDGLLRTPPRLDSEKGVLSKQIDLESHRRASKGETGSLVEEVDGKSVHTGYTPIDVQGLDWVLMVQMDDAEVYAASRGVLVTAVILIIVAAAIITFFAWRLSNHFDRLLGADPAEIFDAADAIASGNLSAKPSESNRSGAFAEIVSMRDKLGEIMGEALAIADDVKRGSEELSEGNFGLSERTEQQAAELQQTSSAMDLMTTTVKRNAENTNSASELANSTSARARSGGEIAVKAIGAMEELGNSSARVVDIIGVIDEIAFQTNLLALNAAVEAARAGEQGRGFAVVASEVRQLAGRSAKAAKEIKELIQDSASKVSSGTELVRDSGAELSAIVESVAELSELMEQISTASGEQSTGIESIRSSLQQMDHSTQQNSALVEEAAATSEKMSLRAAELSQKIGFFSVSAASSSVTSASTIGGNSSGPKAVKKIDAAPKPLLISTSAESSTTERRTTSTRPWQTETKEKDTSAVANHSLDDPESILHQNNKTKPASPASVVTAPAAPMKKTADGEDFWEEF